MSSPPVAADVRRRILSGSKWSVAGQRAFLPHVLERGCPSRSGVEALTAWRILDRHLRSWLAAAGTAALRVTIGVSLPLLIALTLPAATLPREFEVTPTPLAEPPAFITQVVVSNALCAAVSDAASLLVVGQRSTSNQHLAVFRLDAAGKPVGEPARLALPKPAVLAKESNYPLGLLFHPRLPMLYVWQDITAPPQDKQEKHAAFTNWLEFDHLLIYAVKPTGLELVETAAHGIGFHCGLGGGTVGLDAAGKTLFLPNSIGATYDEAGIAYYALDEQGLPVDSDEADATKSRAKPGKEELGTSRFARTVVALQRKRTHRYYPSGAGWFAGSDAMVMGGYAGCMSADFARGGLRQSWFTTLEHVGHCVLAGHPNQPALYLAMQNTPRLFQVAHADGYVSLLPQVASVKGAQLLGAPVVLAQQARVAVGAAKSVFLFGLEADGRLDGKVEQVALPSAAVRGMAYAEKRGRLYVAVDKGE